MQGSLRASGTSKQHWGDAGGHGPQLTFEMHSRRVVRPWLWLWMRPGHPGTECQECRLGGKTDGIGDHHTTWNCNRVNHLINNINAVLRRSPKPAAKGQGEDRQHGKNMQNAQSIKYNKAL